jgi:hypothetical protein
MSIKKNIKIISAIVVVVTVLAAAFRYRKDLLAKIRVLKKNTET